MAAFMKGSGQESEVLRYKTIYMLGVVGLLLAAWGNADARTSGIAQDAPRLPLIDPGLHPAAATSPHPRFDKISALKISQAAIGHTLTGYTFHDRRGRLVKLSAFRGKPLIISLIYTRCSPLCPATTRHLAQVVNTVRGAVGKGSFNVITVGFDPLHDTPERMRLFARQQGVSGEAHWAFLSADQSTITRLTAALGFLFTPSAKGFDHLVQTTVVDADGTIYRQIHGIDFDPGLLTNAMRKLVFGRVPKALSLSLLVSRARLHWTHYDPDTGTYRFAYGMLIAMGFSAVLLIVIGISLVRFLRDP